MWHFSKELTKHISREFSGLNLPTTDFRGLIIALPSFIARTWSRTPFGPKTTTRDRSQARVFINSKRSTEQHNKNATQFLYYLSIGKLASFLESPYRVCARPQKRWNCSNTSVFPSIPSSYCEFIFFSFIAWFLGKVSVMARYTNSLRTHLVHECSRALGMNSNRCNKSFEILSFIAGTHTERGWSLAMIYSTFSVPIHMLRNPL